MEKTVTVGGVQYVVRRRTNLNKVNTNYYKGAIALVYEQLALELGATADDVATALLDYAYISGQVSGGVALLAPTDTIMAIEAKCRTWLTDDTLTALGDILSNEVNAINTVQPDRALAPDPLPDTADPKASSAALRNKKRRARSG